MNIILKLYKNDSYIILKINNINKIHSGIGINHTIIKINYVIIFINSNTVIKQVDYDENNEDYINERDCDNLLKDLHNENFITFSKNYINISDMEYDLEIEE